MIVFEAVCWMCLPAIADVRRAVRFNARLDTLQRRLCCPVGQRGLAP